MSVIVLYHVTFFWKHFDKIFKHPVVIYMILLPSRLGGDLTPLKHNYRNIAHCPDSKDILSPFPLCVAVVTAEMSSMPMSRWREDAAHVLVTDSFKQLASGTTDWTKNSSFRLPIDQTFCNRLTCRFLSPPFFCDKSTRFSALGWIILLMWDTILILLNPCGWNVRIKQVRGWR